MRTFKELVLEEVGDKQTKKLIKSIIDTAKSSNGAIAIIKQEESYAELDISGKNDKFTGEKYWEIMIKDGYDLDKAPANNGNPGAFWLRWKQDGKKIIIWDDSAELDKKWKKIWN